VNTFTGAYNLAPRTLSGWLRKKMADALEESAPDNSNCDVSRPITEVKVSLSTSFVNRYNSRDENGCFTPGQAPKFVMEPLAKIL